MRPTYLIIALFGKCAVAVVIRSLIHFQCDKYERRGSAVL